MNKIELKFHHRLEDQALHDPVDGSESESKPAVLRSLFVGIADFEAY
ncbi:MAG: hypothetical protein PHN44_05260 [Candidatus Marinimicrobia bacterium]|nr:hypothetical protein [Candidatus Neomarinimicrobiota bacterium]